MPDISSLYPSAPQPNQGLFTGDPLKLLGAVDAMNRIQRFGSEQNALGAYTNAMGPNGADPNALAAGLKSRGATFGAPEVMSSALAQRGQGINNDIASLHLAAGTNDFIVNKIAALANSPKVGPEDILGMKATVSRLLPPNVANSSAINATLDQVLKDPQGIKHGLTTLQNQILGAGAATRVAGPPDVEGRQQTIPLGEAGYQSAPTAATGATTSAMPVSLPPGSEASASVMQGDLARAGNFGQEIFPWKQALEKLEALGPAGIGPGTEGRKQVASFIYSALGPTVSRWGGIDPERLKNFDEAQKYLTQATLQRAASFGHGTDQQLATTITGNPNVHINDLAAVDVTKMGIATRAMEHAQTLYASKFGPANYTKAKADFAAQQDPRAYLMSMGLASPEQIDTWKKTLKGAEREKFNTSLRTAKEAGLFQ